MTVQFLSGRSAFDRIAGGRAAATPAAPPRPAWAGTAGMALASTRVSLGGAANGGIAYAMPRLVNVEPSRLWAAAHADALSALMLGNSDPDDVKLADRWRGLGGALLQKLAVTGEGSAQTLAEVTPPPEDEAAIEGAATTDPVADAAEIKARALSDVATSAVTVHLTVTTRSGQSVDLEIAVNDGQHGGTRGLKVQVASSGRLSDAERGALAAMAGGLDQALEGLGQDVPRVDLSRLSEFAGGGELTALDLAIDDPYAANQSGALQAFSLHLDADRKALSLKSTGSEMALSVAAAADVVDGDQRRSAIDDMLAQIDAAAERGHADPLTAGTFKDAFRQLQAPPLDAPASPAERDLPSQVQALESGLADFEASFSGDSQKKNRFGGLIEQGRMDYRIGQTTSSVPHAAAGGQSVTQVQTEASDASIQKTRTLLLDVASGNYDETNIQDRKTVTTLIDTSRTAVTCALRRTEEHRLSAFTSLERGRAIAHHESPRHRSFIERLR